MRSKRMEKSKEEQRCAGACKLLKEKSDGKGNMLGKTGKRCDFFLKKIRNMRITKQKVGKFICKPFHTT